MHGCFEVPARLRASVERRGDPASLQWLQDLPGSLEEALKQTQAEVTGLPLPAGGMGFTIPVRGAFGPAALKLPSPAADADSEAAALRAFSASGVSARLIASGPGWLLTEWVPGRRPDLGEMPVPASAALLRGLRGTRPSGECGTSVEWARWRLGQADPRFHPRFAEVALLVDELEATAADEQLVHGDLASKNIVYDGLRARCFDPVGLRGEAAYEAGFLCALNYPQQLTKTARSLASALDLPPRRVLAWTAVIAFWSAGSPSEILRARYLPAELETLALAAAE